MKSKNKLDRLQCLHFDRFNMCINIKKCVLNSFRKYFLGQSNTLFVWNIYDQSSVYGFRVSWANLKLLDLGLIFPLGTPEEFFSHVCTFSGHSNWATTTFRTTLGTIFKILKHKVSMHKLHTADVIPGYTVTFSITNYSVGRCHKIVHLIFGVNATNFRVCSKHMQWFIMQTSSVLINCLFKFLASKYIIKSVSFKVLIYLPIWFYSMMLRPL